MKKLFVPGRIPFLVLFAGILGLIFRIVLFITGTDHRGLLVSGHWADTACWALTAVLLVVLALCCRPLVGNLRIERLFPPSVGAMLGNIAAAIGVAGAAIRILVGSHDAFGMITGIAGFSGAVCLAAVAYWRLKGQRPNGFSRIAIMIFFMLHLMCQYRSWSHATQLQEYAFPLFAAVFLMLTAYQRAALETRMIPRRFYVFFSQAAAYFCFLSVADDALFFLPMALWLFLDTCSLQVLPKKSRPVQEQHLPKES